MDDLIARLLIVSLFLVNGSYGLLSAVKLKDASASKTKKLFIWLSCYATYIIMLTASAIIIFSVQSYTIHATAYLIMLIFMGVLNYLFNWNSYEQTVFEKIRTIATNLTMAGGLLLLITRG